MKKLKIFIFLLVLLNSNSFSQIDKPLITFERGMLWESFYYAKVAAPFSNWARFDIGMDWPGFYYERVQANIGGPMSHLLSGGFWIGCRDSLNRAVAVEDWAISTGGVTPDNSSRYLAKRHEKLYKNGENYWMKKDPNEAEETIVSEWEYNPYYQQQWTLDRRLPVRVRRTARQWNGSQRDENLVIIEYVIKNIYTELKEKYPAKVLPDSLVDNMNSTYLLFGYGFAINSRGWKVLFPTYNQGARNNRYIYYPVKRLIYGFCTDFLETPNTNEQYDWYDKGGPGPINKGEWLAPGYPGLAFLYIQSDSTGQKNRLNKVCWVAADNQLDNFPVFGSSSAGLDFRHKTLRDPTLIGNSVALTPADSRWQKNKMWTLASIGSYSLKPGDSIKIVTAEVMGGISYADAINPSTTLSKVGSVGLKGAYDLTDRAQFIYDHNYNTIDPPAAPGFQIKLYDKKEGFVANSLSWSDSCENIPDPDYTTSEKYDLAGYRIYRSNYLPIGGWDFVKEIKKGSPEYYDKTTGKYNFVDSTVTIGFSYYYSITSFDTGHSSWPPDPNYRFIETGSNRVPALESSIFANRSLDPFKATIPPIRNRLDKVLVVPNPFIARSGFINPSDSDVIQFINIPDPCTIKIYTIRGDLVKTIIHNDGSGIAFWNQVTDYGQFIESGIYVYKLDTPDGLKKIDKFAIIR